ncbi:MAG TPA: metalloregulator ArsR/SmtB family transcription factor [Thermoanaerobaculia bacterium]|nr:metalloregulator ArsR/SmtB family transcription factor [Thermoanaerobaculia bacterium]
MTALRALAEPRRLEILRLLKKGEMSAGDIAARFRVTRPAISQHLTVLRSAGLIAEKRDGTRRLYRIRPAGLDGLREFLEDFWDRGLSRLKRASESAALSGRRR